MAKHAGGRPRTHSKKRITELLELFKEYINKTDIPIIAEFAYQNDILRDSIYDYEEFSTLRKKAIAKKEAQLEKLSLLNVINPTMAIFSLKQIGWRDKHEITGADGGEINITIKRV